eukprot:4821385-Pleurochrysis_carterae.AAC.6
MMSPVGKTRSKRPAASSAPSASPITTCSRLGDKLVKTQSFTSGAARRAERAASESGYKSSEASCASVFRRGTSLRVQQMPTSPTDDSAGNT